MSDRHRYLLAYDISDPQRLRRVHSCAKRFGYALQYSLFVCDLDRAELVEAKWALGDLIVHTVDRVALIHLGPGTDSSVFHFMGVRPDLPTQGPTLV